MLNCKGQALTRRIDEVISLFANPSIEEIPTPPSTCFLVGYGRRAVLRTKQSELSPLEVILG